MDTPIEEYSNGNIPSIFVKREDLAFADYEGAPPFSKIRGIFKLLEHYKKIGVIHVGYMETAISMASWGISWACREIGGIKPIIYYPKYKELKHNQEKQIAISEKYGAELIPIHKPNYQKVNFYKAKREFYKKYPSGLMLELGLPLEETLTETQFQTVSAINEVDPKTIVVCSGSGNIMAGIIRGMRETKSKATCIGVLAAKKRTEVMRTTVLCRSCCISSGLLPGIDGKQIKIVSSGFDYYDVPEIKAPFDCNEHYDLKAWDWLAKNHQNLLQPILFWNIGGNFNL